MTTWRPDWQHEEEYAFTEGLSAREWAWEFLRRNEEYQRDFEQEVRRWRESGVRKIEEKRLEAAAGLTGPWSDEPDQHLSFFFFSSARCQLKWGLKRWTDPARDGPTGLGIGKHYLFKPGSLVSWEHLAETGLNESPAPPAAMVAAVLDLKWDLQWQLDKIREVAEEKTEEWGIKASKMPARLGDWDLYRDYLRVLDAEHAGADRLEVAKAVWPQLFGEVQPPTGKRYKHNRTLRERQK